MYKGPYVFEFIGACIRWFFLVLFGKDERQKRNLFSKILKGDGTLGERSWNTFAVNFLVGIATVIFVTLIILYIVLS